MADLSRRLGLLVIISVAWAATVTPVYAVKADERERTGTAGRQFPAERAIRDRAVLRSQLDAAKLAAEDGVSVEWNSKLGIPRCVRGLDLGKRRPFSGGKGLTVKAGGQDEQDAIAVLDNLTRIYGIRDAGSEFVSRAKGQDRQGYRHIRAQQIYDGLKVVGGELVTHFSPDGSAREVNGTYIAGIAIATDPHLTPAEALAAAQQDLTAFGNPAGDPAADPELVVFAHQVAPRLAYEVTLLYDDPIAGPGRWRYWVDAMDGSIVFCLNDIKRIAAPTSNGSAATITGSMLTGEGGAATNVTGWRENPSPYTYYLHNTNRHWFVYNSALSGSYPDLNTYAYRSGTSNWSTNDRTEISAAIALDTVQRYFSIVHGRESFDGASSNARANVHFGNHYVNAYWDGADLTFGDGDGVEANALGVLDITGHEFTHAVTEHSANLFYDGESGALNESISDIFGACVEFYGQPNDEASYPSKHAGQADWLVGEDAWLSTKALRDLRNPSNPQTVGVGNELPTRYKGTYWSFGSGDNGGVHVNSGVQNFFFYLLCKGGAGTNDGLAYNVIGIGVTNAEQVAYVALTAYMSPYTDYEAARDAWVSAATNLNPSWSTNVEAAWAAVGVGPAPNTVATPEFSPGEDSYVSPTNVTITTATPGATIYYTLDGTEPTNSSTVYTNAILISSNTTVKAKAYKAGMNPSLTASATYTFLGNRLYYFPMDASEGWTLSGQWGFGVPSGGGGAHGSADPTSGYTGTKVYGYNLSGDYLNRINTTLWLTTTPMNLSTSVNVKLVFYRWLGVEQSAYDHAYIEVSNNGSTWTRMWENSSEVADASWTKVVLDISSVADRQAAVYVRWGIGPTDGSWTYCGWNIDDVGVWGNAAGPPPPVAPSGAHATAVSATEVQLTWLDNSSDEQGFAIERKVGSGSWGEIDRVGLDVTSYLDAVANPAVGPMYRVRAYNAVGYSGYSNTARIPIPGQGLPWLLPLLGE